MKLPLEYLRLVWQKRKIKLLPKVWQHIRCTNHWHLRGKILYKFPFMYLNPVEIQRSFVIAYTSWCRQSWASTSATWISENPANNPALDHTSTLPHAASELRQQTTGGILNTFILQCMLTCWAKYATYTSQVYRLTGESTPSTWPWKNNQNSPLHSRFGEGLSRKPFISAGGMLVTSNCGFLSTTGKEYDNYKHAFCTAWLNAHPCKPLVHFPLFSKQESWVCQPCLLATLDMTPKEWNSVRQISGTNLSFPTPRLHRHQGRKPGLQSMANCQSWLAIPVIPVQSSVLFFRANHGLIAHHERSAGNEQLRAFLCPNQVPDSRNALFIQCSCLSMGHRRASLDGVCWALTKEERRRASSAFNSSAVIGFGATMPSISCTIWWLGLKKGEQLLLLWEIWMKFGCYNVATICNNMQ